MDAEVAAFGAVSSTQDNICVVPVEHLVWIHSCRAGGGMTGRLTQLRTTDTEIRDEWSESMAGGSTHLLVLECEITAEREKSHLGQLYAYA